MIDYESYKERRKKLTRERRIWSTVYFIAQACTLVGYFVGTERWLLVFGLLFFFAQLNSHDFDRWAIELQVDELWALERERAKSK